jgi:hypothetical protein
MKFRGFAPAVVLLAVALPGAAADRSSGPSVGSSATAFETQDITGPNKGKTLCYV